jgi:tetratricopeptide (TPR) repeat protein
MRFIHNSQFTIYTLPLAIGILAIGFLSSSCHNSNIKSGQQASAGDSVSLKGSSSEKHTDTITPKINYYTGRIKEKPNDADAYWNRGNLEMLTKDYGPALGDLTKAVMLDSTKSDYFYSLANVNFLTGHTHEAKDAFIISIRLNPKNTDAILKLAELYFYVKKYDDALTLIEQAIKVNPYLGHEYFLKGMIYLEKHDTAITISSLQTCVEQDPNNFDAYIELGLLFSHRGNPIALSYYEDAVNLQPQNPEPYYDKGMFYQFSGDYNDAIKTYQELLLVDSTYKKAYYNLGVIYNINKADYAASFTYFNKAIKCDSTYYMAYYGRANCYEMLNEKENALADYAHAYRINPGFKEAETAYRQLKSKTH